MAIEIVTCNIIEIYKLNLDYKDNCTVNQKFTIGNAFKYEIKTLK